MTGIWGSSTRSAERTLRMRQHFAILLGQSTREPVSEPGVRTSQHLGPLPTHRRSGTAPPTLGPRDQARQTPDRRRQGRGGLPALPYQRNSRPDQPPRHATGVVRPSLDSAQREPIRLAMPRALTAEEVRADFVANQDVTAPLFLSRPSPSAVSGCQRLSRPARRRLVWVRKTKPRVTQPLALVRWAFTSLQSLLTRRIVHAISGRESRPVTTSVSHPRSRCTSFNLAGMSISWEQVGRQSPQPTQDVPFRVKAAYSFRARSSS